MAKYFIDINFCRYKLSRFRELFWSLRKFIPEKHFLYQGPDKRFLALREIQNNILPRTVHYRGIVVSVLLVSVDVILCWCVYMCLWGNQKWLTSREFCINTILSIFTIKPENMGRCKEPKGDLETWTSINYCINETF